MGSFRNTILMPSSFVRLTIFQSYCMYFLGLPQTAPWQFKLSQSTTSYVASTREMDSLPVVKAGSPRSRCRQGHVCSVKVLGKGLLQASLLASLVPWLIFPWYTWVSLCLNFPCVSGHQANWISPPLSSMTSLILTNDIYSDPIPKWGHMSGCTVP